MESAIEQVAADAIAIAVAQAATMGDARETVPEKALESYSLHRSHYVYAQKRMYRVYDKPGHFSLIEADSAHEAYAKSGVATPFKIERESFFTQVAIAQEMMEAVDELYNSDPELPDGKDGALFVDLVAFDAQLKAREEVFEPLAFADMSAKAPQELPQEEPPAALANVTPAEPTPVVETEEPQPAEAATEEAIEAPVEAEATPEPAPSEGEVVQAAAPEEPEAVVEPELERALTPEEVNALMSGGDED